MGEFKQYSTMVGTQLRLSFHQFTKPQGITNFEEDVDFQSMHGVEFYFLVPFGSKSINSVPTMFHAETTRFLIIISTVGSGTIW